MTQFSLFGAAVAEPTLDDLDGVLLGGGHWARTVTGARLSVVVADRWRADALAVAFAVRGVDCPDAVIAAEGGFAARTGFHAVLVNSAARWTRGANEGPPIGFVLTPGGLRLWAIAAGHPDDVGYLLGTAVPDDASHLVAGAQLARLGVAGVSISGRGEPGWRVTSLKRIRRLVELLGEPPTGAGETWPRTR
ncbi:MAG: hypothetical protein QOI69_666 [Pseudonocardiales bacterium]|jgi:hypothetical protein|nr:hypothetical protein [Pseudonocardiales bacterium]